MIVDIFKDNKQINDLICTLSSLLGEGYASICEYETFSITERLAHERLGTGFKQKLYAETAMLKKLNVLLNIADLLEKYNKVIKQYRRVIHIYNLQKLLQACEADSDDKPIDRLAQYDSLSNDKDTLEKELHVHGITKDWLDSVGLGVLSAESNKPPDVIPQKRDESNAQFLKRAIGCANSYRQALEIYINSFNEENLLLLDNLKNLRICLINRRLVSEITCNTLYDDINNITS